MDGETARVSNPFCDDGDDWKRDKVMGMVEWVTSDPIEQKITKLMLENYTEIEFSEMLNISPTKVQCL